MTRTFCAGLVVAFAIISAALSMNVPQGSDRTCSDANFLRSPPAQDVKNVISRGQRDFSVNLIKQMFEAGEKRGELSNIFVSPSSIYQTLMLAYFGAGGQTEKELLDVLGLQSPNITNMDKDEVKKSFLYDQAFQAVRERSPDLGYKLIHANKLYFDRSLPLHQCIQLLLKDDLGAVDFQNNAEKARQEINAWVKQKTLKKIDEILPPGSLDSSTTLALVNAAYFKGEWKSKFKPEDTKIDNFYVKRDKIRPVKFMKQEGPFNYYAAEELRAHVLQLPYVGDALSMVIILPPWEEDALQQTVSRMTPEKIQGVMQEIRSGFYKADDLEVIIPKFHIEQSLELSATLGELGLNTLFNSANSNLTSFLEEGSKSEVSLESAIHKSYIDVNEEGSEAAAATVLFGFRSARPYSFTEFIANHPFLFFIYDEQSDNILFFGVVQDPKEDLKSV